MHERQVRNLEEISSLVMSGRESALFGKQKVLKENSSMVESRTMQDLAETIIFQSKRRQTLPKINQHPVSSAFLEDYVNKIL
jgi:hypothetical protein